MAEKIPLHKVTKGSLMETEDWWYLHVDDAEVMTVEHEWSHTSAYKTGKGDQGSKINSVQDFLAGDAPDGAKDALRSAIAERAMK